MMRQFEMFDSLECSVVKKNKLKDVWLLKHCFVVAAAA